MPVKAHAMCAAQAALTGPAAALAQQLKIHRPFLLHLAQAQLGDRGLAEDVVQEAILAAWQGLDAFQSRSSVRTWLVGILRFKILDALRQRSLHLSRFVDSAADPSSEGVQDELLFDASGQWRDMPHAWEQDAIDGSPGDAPEQQLLQKQLLGFLELCLTCLPPRTSQIFLMREYLGFENPEIAQQLGLQTGHVRVVLCRARLTLKTCLDQRLQWGEKTMDAPQNCPDGSDA